MRRALRSRRDAHALIAVCSLAVHKLLHRFVLVIHAGANLFFSIFYLANWALKVADGGGMNVLGETAQLRL